MLDIIIEGTLFVALIATVGALLFWAVRDLTPLGRVMHQARNRRRIERVADLTCPTHGFFGEHELVRLPHGAPVCPKCYEEIVHGKHDQ